IAGALLLLAATLLYPLALSVAAIAGVRLLQGLAYGAQTGAGATLSAELVPAERRGEGLGVYAAGINVAQVGGPALAVAVLTAGGFGPIFALAAAIGLAAIVFSALVPAAAAGTPERSAGRGAGPLPTSASGGRPVGAARP